ncbi:MAG: putative lipid II flippase FtsW [Myxococcales bacterium]|nr:putative lipid II flippase FtsW [Myxococcota bacterium]MDW8280517.1 putative lipid II flippase FtsW [Myxococcales bacterium]
MLLPPQQDPILYTLVIALCGFGVVMVFSASAVYARQTFGTTTYFLHRCLLWNLIGLAGMMLASRLDFSIYRRLVYPLLGLAVALLGAVLIVGVRINGARRWFHIAGVSFQPAEMAKLALIIYLAYSLSRKADKVRLFAVGFLPHLVVCGVIMLLLLKQPDLGTAVIAGGVTLMLLFIAGAKVSYLILAMLAATPALYQAIVGTPWRMRRILAFLDPWQFRYDVGYQITESLISVGSGGLTGLGLGDGKQKLFFLPEAHTDYIMAIVGEELGFVGITAVALAFCGVISCGFRAAWRARDAFGCYLAAGITSMLGLQAVINLGVVLGSLPTKGLPMPFVSFGGSSLVIDLWAVGMLLNISRGAAAPSSPRWGRLLLQLLGGARSNRRRPGGGRRVRIETGVPTRPELAPNTVRSTTETPQ